MIRRRATSQAGAPTGRRLPRRPEPPTTTLREKLTWALTFIVVGAGLAYVLWSALSLVFAAAVFAYMLAPIVNRIAARGLAREASIAAVFGLALTLVLLAGLIVIPAVANQFQDLSGNIDAYIQRASEQIGPAATWLEQRSGVHIPLDLTALQGELPGWLSRLSPDTRASAQEFLSNLFSSGLGFVLGLVDVLLVPLFIFYLLRDWHSILSNASDLVPMRHRTWVLRIVREVNERLSAFIRGQITLCLALGVLYSTGLWIAGIDLPFVIGMSAGILFIIPYFGTAVGVVLATLLALLKYGVDAHLIYVVLVFGVSQLIEGSLLTPFIVGDKVGLHPMVVMVALIAGGSLLGIWGLLFAIPVAATVHVLLSEGLVLYRQSNVFGR